MCLVKSSFVEFISFLMLLSQSVVLSQGSGGIQKISLFGKRPSPYYGKNSWKRKRETISGQHMWELFKTVWKAFQVKLVEGMQRVCKPVIKAKGGYFEESQIYIFFDLLLLVTTLFHMCYFIVLMSSLLFYNVENSKNKEKHLNE